jgi:O-antigen/teichoic acid export membrane protein
MLRRLAGVGITSVVAAALAMIAAGVLAHRLGPSGTGEYQSVIRWASIWMILGMFGFAHASSYFASHADDARIRTLVGNSIKTTFAQSTILVIGGYLIGPYIFRTPNSLLGARVFLIYIPLNLLITNLAHIAVGGLNTRVFNTLRLLQAVAFLTIVIPLVLVDPTSVAPLIATVVAATVALAYLLFAFNKSHQIQLKTDGALWKSTAAFGIKAYPGVVGRELNLFVDQLLISVLLPTRFLGLYAAAVSATSVVSVATSAFFYLAQPETQNASPSEVAQSTATMSRLTVACLVPLAVALVIAMPIVLPLVYGDAFKPAVTAAQILCLAGALDGIVVTLAGAALGLGRPLLSTVAQVGSVGLEVALVLILLPSIGIAGAAFASVVAYGMCAIFLVFALARLLKIAPSRLLVPTRRDVSLLSELLRQLFGRKPRKDLSDAT